MLLFLRVQLALLARSPRLIAPLIITPFYSLVFFAALRQHHQGQLATSVSITAALMCTWTQAVFVASDAVDYDRWEGTLEMSLLTPDRYARALAARIITTTALSLPALAEILLIGRLGFGLPVHFDHPLLAVAVLPFVLLGSAGAALAISSLLIVVRGARTVQNALTYPAYLLGGLILPISVLPAPFEWIGRVFYLSWGTQLLRDAATSADPTHLGPRFLVLAVLTAASCLAGWALLHHVMRLVRSGSAQLYG